MSLFDEQVRSLKISDFIDSDFRSFSTYDCVINIPNMIDGFKVSQRKVMWGVQKEGKKTTVERYSSKIADMSAYHHGAKNLESVIVGLAQDFDCSNNVNWLEPDGQFGNILDPNASSGRYISAGPISNFRKWFSKDDDIILEYEYEDGEQIEPRYFIPIVPTILFNGSSGIGTGYACTVLQYKPEDVVRNVKEVLKGKRQSKLIPWYRGYKGLIQKVEGQTIFTGKFERINSTKLRITQLPIGYTIDKYKGILAKLIDNEVIKDYDDESTEAGWDITIIASRDFIGQPDSVLIDKLQLVSRDSENIVVWDEKGKIKRFENPEDLLEYFVEVRLAFYDKRRLALIDALKVDIDWKNTKARFIQYYIDNVDFFKDTKKDKLIERLIEDGFPEYDKLLAMSMWNLTKEKIQSLQEEIKKDLEEVKRLEVTTAKEMYLDDL